MTLIKLQRAEAREIAHQMSGIAEFCIKNWSRNMPHKIRICLNKKLFDFLSEETVLHDNTNFWKFAIALEVYIFEHFIFHSLKSSENDRYQPRKKQKIIFFAKCLQMFSSPFIRINLFL